VLNVYEPLPEPIFVALHVAFIGNAELFALAAVAILPSMNLSIVTVTFEGGVVDVKLNTEPGYQVPATSTHATK
jgi:hypothetical protein